MADSKSSGTDTVVKIILVFFISLLSFSIGTFVGKKFSDNQHKMISMEPNKKLPISDEDPHNASIESESEISNNLKETTPEANEVHSVAANSKIHETESLNDEQVAALEGELTGEEDLSSTTTKLNVNKIDLKNKIEDENSDVSTAPKLTKVLAKELSQSQTAKFTIQISSYPSQEEAEKKVTELKAMKFESFSTETTIKGHQWYRVNVGMFATIKEAQEQKVLLAEKAKVSTAIIQKLKR